jgi:hypothetical protein
MNPPIETIAALWADYKCHALDGLAQQELTEHQATFFAGVFAFLLILRRAAKGDSAHVWKQMDAVQAECDRYVEWIKHHANRETLQ